MADATDARVPTDSGAARADRAIQDLKPRVQRTKPGKRQSWGGMAVPHTTPQARRAQKGMPVELLPDAARARSH
jgi:hypothetical protein